MKQELEMAMKLLEKDIYDKQDGLITLREQLDNVKAINVDIYRKLQVRMLYNNIYSSGVSWILSCVEVVEAHA